MANGLIDLVDRLAGRRALVVGDFMLDTYLYGSADRLSPEAPVPVLHFHHEDVRLGGAGHVAADLAALGLRVRVAGTCGDDPAGRQLKSLLADAGVDPAGLLPDAGRPTTRKVRLVGMAQHRTPQQLIRLDYEQSRPLPENLRTNLIKSALAGDPYDVILVEDYAKGVCDDALVRALIDAARARDVPVIVDPPRTRDLARYAGATALKLNRGEAAAASGLPCHTPDDAAAAARKILDDLGLDAVVVTLDRDGASLAARDGTSRHLTTRARSVADVTGAGDVFLATLAAARAAGADWPDATALANVASGLEVERFGAVPVRPDEIVAQLLHDLRLSAGKRRTPPELARELRRRRQTGQRVVFTNGCFDLVHLGHVNYFRFAKSQGDVLVVGVNSDDSVRRLKGEKRPIVTLDDRLGVLEELESIDYLVVFDDDTPLSLIDQLGPDVLVKGADYTKQQVVGHDLVEARGGRVALAPLAHGRSTSGVIDRIIAAYT